MVRDLKSLCLEDGTTLCQLAVDVARGMGKQIVVFVVDVGGHEIAVQVRGGLKGVGLAWRGVEWRRTESGGLGEMLQAREASAEKTSS